jgi:hypothetical protein
MSCSCFYSPETVKLMAAVYKLAAKELKLDRGTRQEQERLAVCILSIANTYRDIRQLLDKTIHIYARAHDRQFARNI